MKDPVLQVDELFKSVGEPGEFLEKTTGYLVSYSPLCCAFLETDDAEFLEKVM